MKERKRERKKERSCHLTDVDVVGSLEAHVELGEEEEDGVPEVPVLDQGHAHVQTV